MNDYESDRTFRLFHDQFGYDWTDDAHSADLVMLNTCSIREKADQKAMSFVGDLKRTKDKRPGMVIAVGGCMAQIQGAEIQRRFPFVDIVFGTHQWNKLPELVMNAQQEQAKIFQIQQMENDFTSWKNYSFLPVNESNGTFPVRENVTIQNGCNHFCTFCLVPFTRGREVSRPIQEILHEVKMLADRGVKEINLLGQNVNAYGTDKRGEPNFAELLQKVSQVNGVERIRFVTSHPAEMTFEMIDVMAENKKICEHLHLPLQSGSDRILDLMERGYHVDRYRELIQYLRKRIPNVLLTTDMIVGFPTETEEDFQMTLSAIEEFDYDESYSFVYSPRPHTKAEKWVDQFVNEEVAKERLSRLQKLQRKIKDSHSKSLVGQTVEVLVESVKEGMATGRTRGFQSITFPGDTSFLCSLKNVKITNAYTYNIQGIPQ